MDERLHQKRNPQKMFIVWARLSAQRGADQRTQIANLKLTDGTWYPCLRMIRALEHSQGMSSTARDSERKVASQFSAWLLAPPSDNMGGAVVPCSVAAAAAAAAVAAASAMLSALLYRGKAIFLNA